MVVIDHAHHRDVVAVVAADVRDLVVVHVVVVAVADEAVDVMTVAAHFMINQHTRNTALQKKQNTRSKSKIFHQDAAGRI